MTETNHNPSQTNAEFIADALIKYIYSEECNPRFREALSRLEAADAELARLKKAENKCYLVMVAAGHLLQASKQAVPGGPTDWEETRQRIFQKIEELTAGRSLKAKSAIEQETEQERS